MTVADRQLRAWLATWADHVRRVDYSAARALFDDDVTGFGSRVAIAAGRRSLEARQWRRVWPHIAGFRFDLRRFRTVVSADGRLAAAWGPWTSVGYHADGTPFARPGRATILLRRLGDGWRAFHTHFSLVPGTPTHSRRPVTTVDPIRRARRAPSRTRPRTPRARARGRGHEFICTPSTTIRSSRRSS